MCGIKLKIETFDSVSHQGQHRGKFVDMVQTWEWPGVEAIYGMLPQ